MSQPLSHKQIERCDPASEAYAESCYKKPWPKGTKEDHKGSLSRAFREGAAWQRNRENAALAAKLANIRKLCDEHDSEWASVGDDADCDCPLSREVRAIISDKFVQTVEFTTDMARRALGRYLAEQEFPTFREPTCAEVESLRGAVDSILGQPSRYAKPGVE